MPISSGRKIPGQLQVFPEPLMAETPQQQRELMKAQSWRPSPRLMDHVKLMENPGRQGRDVSKGRWGSYWVNGYETYGYGHEITKEEKMNGFRVDEAIIPVKKGLTDAQVDRLLEQDLAKCALLSNRVVTQVCGNGQWDLMEQRARDVCIDYTYKMGRHFFIEYPAFLKALVSQNIRLALKEAERHFRGNDGKLYTLKPRREALKGFLTEFGRPLKLGLASRRLEEEGDAVYHIMTITCLTCFHIYVVRGNTNPAKLHWQNLSRPMKINPGSIKKPHGFLLSSMQNPDSDSRPMFGSSTLPQVGASSTLRSYMLHFAYMLVRIGQALYATDEAVEAHFSAAASRLAIYS